MRVKTIKMADILWEAANKHLRTDAPYAQHGPSSHLEPTDEDEEGLSTYSCNAAEYAVREAVRKLSDGDERWESDAVDQVDDFLKFMGVRTGSYRNLQDEFPRGEDRQGVRYMWLLLTSHIAADQGLTVEVEVW